MEQKTENTFSQLCKELQEDIEEGTGTKTETETKTTPLFCNYCDWKTHAGSKDKERGLKNHIKAKHPEHYNPKEFKKVKQFEILPPKVSEIADEIEMVGKDEDHKREKLIGDLDLLRVKFSTIDFNWSYTPNSSIAHLQRQKKLFLRVLNDEAGTEAIFNLLVIGGKAIEKVADSTNMVDIEGYSKDIKNNKEEIYPILKNMVDTGVLDVGQLTPELRLGMIMTSLAINRMDINKIQKNNFLEEGVEPEP